MNFKKISLALVALSILFSTDSFAVPGFRSGKSFRDEIKQTLRYSRPSLPARQKQFPTPLRGQQRIGGIRKPAPMRPVPLRKIQFVAPTRPDTRRLVPVKRPATPILMENVSTAKRKVFPKVRPGDSNVPEGKKGQWRASYVLTNGIIVKRDLNKISVYNNGRSAVGREQHFPKGKIIRGRRLASNVDLTLKQNQAEFQKQITKLGTIKKITPLNN